MGGTFFFPGLPYSMKQAGFPLGILLLFWVSYVTGKKYYIIAYSCNLNYAMIVLHKHTYTSPVTEFPN